MGSRKHKTLTAHEAVTQSRSPSRSRGTEGKLGARRPGARTERDTRQEEEREKTRADLDNRLHGSEIFVGGALARLSPLSLTPVCCTLGAEAGGGGERGFVLCFIGGAEQPHGKRLQVDLGSREGRRNK
ncbi:hypothetical protein SKAU_G00163220 [Synaphobranchus kaupii]|uniref:Uncharacterized protein n=1 Tax=Synaphobranchus kaupii TaxID=118154 RepID=A0A9Q1FIX2_SYNKA|nr:hypothetical protein SKAU_G00163220 [Synaphobranchus kaupii]